MSRVISQPLAPYSIFFFFNDTATTEIYTLSLHDALPICILREGLRARGMHESLRVGAILLFCLFLLFCLCHYWPLSQRNLRGDRKSTRLNSSHGYISYAVFCLKKKKIMLPMHTIS